MNNKFTKYIEQLKFISPKYSYLNLEHIQNSEKKYLEMF